MNKRGLRSSYTDYNTGRSNYDQPSPQRSAPQQQQQRSRKRVPPEQTHAENYYYRKQMEARTPMALVLNDGETILGTIEWYDKSCLKIHRHGGPNLLVFKHNIKYLYKHEKFETRAAKSRPVEEIEVIEEDDALEDDDEIEDED